MSPNPDRHPACIRARRQLPPGEAGGVPGLGVGRCPRRRAPGPEEVPQGRAIAMTTEEQCGAY